MGRLRMRSGSCPRQHTPPMVLCRSKNRVSSIPLPVVLALILLPAIAFASPPDPSWIAGIYAGADGNDIVNLVYETWAASAAASTHIGPSPSMPGILIGRITPRLPGSQFAQGPRTPPAVGSKVSGSWLHVPCRLHANRITHEAPATRASIPEFRILARRRAQGCRCLSDVRALDQ